MSGTFPGRIVLVEGDEVDVDLQIASEKIRLATPFAEIGLWDRDSIHFERNAAGGYELSVADDVVTFYPTDVEAFAEALEDNVDDEGSTAADLDRPVSLVPGLIDDDVDTEEPDAPEPAPEPEDEPVSRFGPSSRERLAAAMSSFRERQEEAEAQEPAQSEEYEADDAVGRTSSPGFMIPGDAGYSLPESDEPVEEQRHSIHFDEELEDDTLADQVIETSRSLRSGRSLSFDKAKLRKVGIGVVAVAVLAAMAFAVPVVIDFFTASDDTPTAETTPQTTVPTTSAQETTPSTTATTAVESTVASEPLAFDLASDAFVERWNETAARVSPSLRFRSSLPASDFEVGFTSYIAMIGSFAGPGSGIDTYTLEIDPTGPSSSDQLGIQALGLAIAVADPSLEPNERAAVLAEMGLNVRDPELGGLNGATTRNGVDYLLVFDSEDVVLRLTVSPQSP